MPVMSALERAFCRSAPWRAFARRAVLPWALGDTPIEGDVLEIGGGSGAMAAGAAQSYPGISLTLTDIDPAMADLSRRRLAAWPNVTVEQADVTALPFDDQSFDIVTSYLMLHHVINWLDALAEISRVLRPGGVLVGYDLTDTRLARWVHRVDGSPHCIIAPDELAYGLTVAGFTVTTVRKSCNDHLMRFQGQKPKR